MKVTSIAFTAYPGKDVPKLLAFYRDVVGLRVDRAHPSEEDARLVEFDVGNDHWFTLMPEKMLERPAGSGSGIVFQVDDIEGMLDRIKPHARAIEEIADYSSCRMTSFEDPEGNKVTLHQQK